MTTNSISRTPDYSTFNHNGAQYVRLDKTNPETGEQASLIFRPDQLSPTQHVQYVDFMCKKAEIDQQEIREIAAEITEEVRRIEKNLDDIVEERNEFKKGFIEFLKEKKKMQDATNAAIHREGFFAPVAKAFSSMADGIKSFFS